MTELSIDINCDLGEGFGAWRIADDEALLDVVTSANVACGFHAGDPRTMHRVCRHAVERGVRIGAHVGYRDLAGFGRRYIDIAPADLESDVLYQLGALDAMARSAGGEVSYIKPHGALYDAVSRHEGQAAAVVDAVCLFEPGLPVLGRPGSVFLNLAEQAGLPTVAEAFADRAYRADGGLVSRREPGATLSDPDAVARQSVRLVLDNEVKAADGAVVRVEAGSLCVHSDTPGALELARVVRSALTDAGVTLRSFS